MSKSTLLALFFLFLPKAVAADSILSPSDFLSCDSIIGESNERDLWNNWFISVGANMPTDREKFQQLGKEKAITLDRALNEMDHTGLGVREMYSTLSIKGVLWNGSVLGNLYQGGKKQTSDPYNQLSLHADILFNASNLVFDYKEERNWMLLKTQGDTQKKSAVDINLNIEGTYVGFRASNKEQEAAQRKNISATLGFTYLDPDAKMDKVEIPIGNSERWNEHCNRMMFINEAE